MAKAKFLNVLLEERDPEKEAVGFFGNWAKHSIEQKQKERYDWRYENSITKGKKQIIDGDYSQWRTNNVIAGYRGLTKIVNEVNIRYGITDQMHYDYLYGSVRKQSYERAKAETEKEKKDRKKQEELLTLVSNYYKYNNVRTKEALKILTAEQIEIIRNKNNKGGVK
jgi:hypothetical protein